MKNKFKYFFALLIVSLYNLAVIAQPNSPDGSGNSAGDDNEWLQFLGIGIVIGAVIGFFIGKMMSNSKK